MKERLIVSMLTLVVISSPLLADEGKDLYENNCTKCHGTEVFSREDRGIKSLEDLKSRVKQCSLAAQSNWFDEEINSVADYLNKNFYKF